MSQKLPPSFHDDVIRINLLSLDGTIPPAEAELYSRAKGVMDYNTMIAIHNKYPAELPKSASQAPKAVEPTQTTTKESKVNHEAKKASLTYKKLTRVLKYQTLKEEVLLDHNHTCFCCGVAFAPRSQFLLDNPGEKYPLMVRCNFPLVKYIEVTNAHNIPELLKDTKVMSPQNYLPICADCKPMSFKRSE